MNAVSVMAQFPSPTPETVIESLLADISSDPEENNNASIRPISVVQLAALSITFDVVE